MEPESQGTQAVVIAISGPAGSGKTTLGRELAASRGLPLLDLDSITNPLLDRLGAAGWPVPGGHWLAASAADPDSGSPGASAAAVAIREGRYAALRAVARDVVPSAGGAVLVAPFTAELRGGREWEDLLAAVAPATVSVVHLVGDDDLFETRRTTRAAPRDRSRPRPPAATTPSIPVLPVEAELSPAQQLARVEVGLGRRTPSDPSNPLFDQDFDAVLFDLDGTLVDSTGSVIRSWRRFAVEFGVPMRALHENHGQPARTLVERLLPAGQVTTGLARIGAIEVADAERVRAALGAGRLYCAVPADRRAVVTSGSVPIATARLAAAGLDRPRVLVTADDVEHGKPDPEPFLVAARLLGVDPRRCLAVEDAPAGVRSAVAAGCRALAVTGTATAPELHEAGLVVDGLDRVAVRLEDGALRLGPAT